MMQIDALCEGADIGEIKKALRLALRVFLEYDAPLFEPEGKESFRAYIMGGTIEAAVLDGRACIFAAYDGDDMVGMMCIDAAAHINLLFVEGGYQKHGVGSALIEEAFALHGNVKYTVNAAPPGYSFYRKHGFIPASREERKGGLTYTPMLRARRYGLHI